MKSRVFCIRGVYFSAMLGGGSVNFPARTGAAQLICNDFLVKHALSGKDRPPPAYLLTSAHLAGKSQQISKHFNFYSLPQQRTARSSVQCIDIRCNFFQILHKKTERKK